jgi:soluble lytic murein transglycosylase-like protein
MPDYTVSQFDTSQYHQAYATLEAICGPNVAEAFQKFYGNSTFTPDQIVNLAQEQGLWSQATGMHGPQAEEALLNRMGIPAQYSPTLNVQDLQNKVMSGSMGAISTPGHYFDLQGYDPNTGLYDTGQTGSVYKGGGRYLSMDQMQKLAGPVSGVFTLAPNQQQVQSSFNPQTQTQSTTGQTGVPPEFVNKPYAQEAYNAAVQAGIDPNIFLRQINQESGFNPNAGSPAGAQGIAQIVPKYHPGVNTSDPIASLNYAANLDKQLLTQYGGDYTKALVGYNGGQGAVDAWNSGKGYTESKTYVNNILSGQTPAAFGQSNAPQNTNVTSQSSQSQSAGPQRPQGVQPWIPQSMWGEYNGGPTSLGNYGNILQGGGLSNLVRSMGQSLNYTGGFSMPAAQQSWLQGEQNIPQFSPNMFTPISSPLNAPPAQPNLMSRMSNPGSLYG